MYSRKYLQLSTVRNIFLSFAKKGEKLTDLIFPPFCLSCKKEGEYFCEKCRERLPEQNTMEIRGVVSLWRYDNPVVRESLVRLKYRGKKKLAEALSSSLYDKILLTLSEDSQFEDPLGKTKEKYIIIPIPMHKTRKKLRGYNQAELLAKELSKKDETLFVFDSEILKKIKPTESQVKSKNREKRLINIKGSFAVIEKEKILGKKVILVDDVVTTGTTLKEASKMLRKAGAKRVFSITVAH